MPYVGIKLSQRPKQTELTLDREQKEWKGEGEGEKGKERPASRAGALVPLTYALRGYKVVTGTEAGWTNARQGQGAKRIKRGREGKGEKGKERPASWSVALVPLTYALRGYKVVTETKADWTNARQGQKGRLDDGTHRSAQYQVHQIGNPWAPSHLIASNMCSLYQHKHSGSLCWLCEPCCWKARQNRRQWCKQI